MTTKVLFFGIAALIALSSPVIGMIGEGVTPNTTKGRYGSQTPGDEGFFTPQESPQEQAAQNRARADGTNADESEENDSSLQQRGSTVRFAEDHHKDVLTQSGEEARIYRNLFETPTQKTVAASKEINTEPFLKKRKQDQEEEVIPLRKGMPRLGGALDVDEVERMAWLGSAQEVNSFSQIKRALTRWISQKSEEDVKKLEEKLQDPEKIKAIRSEFVSTLEQCYGQDFVSELFSEGGKEQFLAQEEPLSPEEAICLIQKADGFMQEGKSYLQECQEMTGPLQEALDAFNVAQEQAREAQETYNAMNGTPYQFFIASVWKTIKTVTGTISTVCFVVLVVFFHQGIPVLLGSVAVGLLVSPAQLHRFLGCLFIFDNITSMRDSWGKHSQACVAENSLHAKKDNLQVKRRAVEELQDEVTTRKERLAPTILPALKREIDQMSQSQTLLKLQETIEGFRGQE